MTTGSATAGPPCLPSRRDERLRAPVLGMVLFIASEVMFFGGLFGAYYTLRANASQWPPAGSPEIELALPLVLTVVLLSSSLTQHLVMNAVARDDGRAATRWLAATVFLGTAFIAGEGWEWSRLVAEDFTVSSNIFGTLFFTMTGFHGLHLVAGLVMLLLALSKARGPAPHPTRVGAMEAATLYWHFVDGVWIFLLTSLYVLNAL
ncbi:heme-copper oxidase subunit III [soil metagenome]